MAIQTRTYPIVESVINLLGDWLKHGQEIRELHEINSGDFARIAHDLLRYSRRAREPKVWASFVLAKTCANGGPMCSAIQSLTAGLIRALGVSDLI